MAPGGPPLCLEAEGSDETSPVPTLSPVSACPVQKSWVTVVQNKSALSKFDVEVAVVEGKAMVAVPDEILEDATPLWDDFLVGRFPSEAPHVAKIHVIVNKIWNLGDKSIRIDVFKVNDKTIKFRIRNASARQRVLRRGMWNICDLPMVVSKWTPIAEDAQPEIKSLPMWVTIKNVPHSMFTWKGLSFLASPVGTPKRLHPETEQVVNFAEAKIFVEVDMTKELPKTYYFQIKGVEVGVSFEYPWLPPRCGICGKWGHLVENCLANAVSAVGKVSVPTPVLLVEPRSDGATCSHADPAVVGERITRVAATDAQVHQSVILEEGEIGSSAKPLDSSNDGEWLTVNHSSGSKRDKVSPKQLVYGQVRIVSPTRFDVLREEDAESLGLLQPGHIETSKSLPAEDQSLFAATGSEAAAGEQSTEFVGVRENALTADTSGNTPSLRILPSRIAKEGSKVTGRKNSKLQQGAPPRCIGKKASKNVS